MKHEEKVQWMALFAARNRATLDLEGECGIGRECVGLSANGSYASYAWFDDDYERIDNNGEVWRPKHAYHKHDCVAVLGRGVEAEEELYEWLRWFDDNGFILETGSEAPPNGGWDEIDLLFGRHTYTRMVKKEK